MNAKSLRGLLMRGWVAGWALLLAFALVFVLNLAYRGGSLLGAASVVVGLIGCLLFYEVVRRSSSQLQLFLLAVILLFAPPSIVFDTPIKLLGANLLPAYILLLLFSAFRLAKNPVWLDARSFALPASLVIIASLQFPLMFIYGWQNDLVEVAFKALLLLALLSVFFYYTAYHIFFAFESDTAFRLLVFVLLLQLYQGYVFFFNGNDDSLLWFGGDHWLRFGLGYAGDGLNPARMYALFWDPNYLISVAAPLYLFAKTSNMGWRQAVLLDFVFISVVLMTLSYQSMLIAMIVIVGIRFSDHASVSVRRFAIACALMMPIVLLGIGMFGSAADLPPPELSSQSERLHIVWAVSQAIYQYPLGSGLGAFETLGGGLFFDAAMNNKTLPPHGWLFEILVYFGLVGYYMAVFVLSWVMKNSSKSGNISFAGLMLWGVTSPALVTPYFWLFFALTVVLSRLPALRLPGRPFYYDRFNGAVPA